MSNSPEGFEIERKYLIRYPEQSVLDAADRTEITQTYLLRNNGMSERVRKRGVPGDWHYYYTRKKLISGFTRVELEDEVTESEYLELLKNADPGLNVIEKVRYCLSYSGQTFEIDVYPFWTDRATMEIELPDEETPVALPPEVSVIREVTGDKRYNNSSLAHTVYTEELESKQ